MHLTISFYSETLTIHHSPPTPTPTNPHPNQPNTILSLKNTIELFLGLPIELQILSFIDNLDLPNEKSLEYFGIVHKSKLNLKIKSEIDYKDIFLGSRFGDLGVLKENGVLEYVVVKVGFFRKRIKSFLNFF